YREWRREKNKNADDTVQKSIDGTKQIKRIQEACMISWHCYRYGQWRKRTRTTRSRSRTTRSRTVDEDIRYMWFPKGPNSVSLG
ncbi:hypothetical protein T4B_11970, partial [Trichinella pseudospiralis]